MSPLQITWMGPEAADRLAEGDMDVLLHGLCALANEWTRAAGLDLAARDTVLLTRIAYARSIAGEKAPQQLALLAAGCDLVDLLRSTPQGREALRKFCLEPLGEQAKGE